MVWKAAPHITSQWGHITLLEQGLPAPLSTLPPKNHVNIIFNSNHWSTLCHSSAFVWDKLWAFLLPAPSQPPVKVMWNTSNSKIILNWEQVKALENESEVTGYKVSTQSTWFYQTNWVCCRDFCFLLLTWFDICPQVLYKKNQHSRPNIMETNTTSVELALPTDEDYIIQIKPFGEGGEGSSSRQITIPKIPGQWRAS